MRSEQYEASQVEQPYVFLRRHRAEISYLLHYPQEAKEGCLIYRLPTFPCIVIVHGVLHLSLLHTLASLAQLICLIILLPKASSRFDSFGKVCHVSLEKIYVLKQVIAYYLLYYVIISHHIIKLVNFFSVEIIINLQNRVYKLQKTGLRIWIVGHLYQI